jgi:hypothetical protein
MDVSLTPGGTRCPCGDAEAVLRLAAERLKEPSSSSEKVPAHERKINGKIGRVLASDVES